MSVVYRVATVLQIAQRHSKPCYMNRVCLRSVSAKLIMNASISHSIDQSINRTSHKDTWYSGLTEEANKNSKVPADGQHVPTAALNGNQFFSRDVSQDNRPVGWIETASRRMQAI
jgi:hypothetical protein